MRVETRTGEEPRELGCFSRGIAASPGDGWVVILLACSGYLWNRSGVAFLSLVLLGPMEATYLGHCSGAGRHLWLRLQPSVLAFLSPGLALAVPLWVSRFRENRALINFWTRRAYVVQHGELNPGSLCPLRWATQIIHACIVFCPGWCTFIPPQKIMIAFPV